MSPIDQLRLAFPDASAPALLRLRNKARTQARGLAAAETKALRLDQRKLCRLLQLQGWEHLHAIRESGGLLLLPKLGARRLAHRALDLYLPGLRWAGKAGSTPDPKAGGNAAAAGQEDAQNAGCGEILAMDFDLPVKANGALIPFLGQQIQADPRAAQLATEHAFPILPVLCLPFVQGGFHLAFHQAIQVDTDDGATGSDATASGDRAVGLGKLATWLEGMVRRHPELWDWQERV